MFNKLLLLAFLSAVPSAIAENTSLSFTSGVYLLLDDALIEQSSNIVRRICSPQRDLARPVVTAAEDHNFQPYVTVLQDPSNSRYRMWYNVPIDGGQSHLALIESPDAIHFTRPHVVLDDPGHINFGASILDDGPAFADPSKGFKFAYYYEGLRIAFSADGRNWKLPQSGPSLTGVNDIVHLARDPARNRYIAVFGFPSSSTDGYQGKPHHAKEGYRRCVGQSVSTNCVDWSPPRRIIAPDSLDEGITEYYSIGGVVNRGSMLVGLLKVLRDDLPCDPAGPVEGIGYTTLAWSHDGEHWQRDRKPFFDRNPESGSWDHAMAWMDYQLPVDDDMFLYYGGYARGHKVERFRERQIGLVRIKRDRYIAREARGPGFLQTKLFKFSGKSLALNANAANGEIRACVSNAAGKTLPGFDFSDCQPIRSNSTSAPVRWKKDLRELTGKTLRLNLFLQDSELYALEVF
jgi:hypothetical protein